MTIKTTLPALLVLTAALAASPGALADDKQDCVTASESAQKLRDDHKLLKAREQFLVCSRDVCPAVIKKDCVESIADVEKRTPTIVVRAHDGKGADLVAVKVTIDGVAAADSLDGKSIKIDPGVHKFRFETEGQEPLEQSIVVGEGERDRPVIAGFGGGATGGGGAGPATSAPKGAPIAAIAVGAVGVVAAAVGGVFYGLGLSERSSDLSAGCPTTDACNSDKDSIRTKLVVGDIAMGVGIVGIGAGIILAIVHYSGGGSKEQSARLPVLDFRSVAGGGVMTAGLRF